MSGTLSVHGRLDFHLTYSNVCPLPLFAREWRDETDGENFRLSDFWNTMLL